jgi:hypothetical protein
MARLPFVAALAILLAAALTGSALAADIVTVPTANQLSAGQLDLAYYYIGLDLPAGAPQHVNVQTLYYGLTEQLELDLHRYQVDKGSTDTIVNATWKFMDERRDSVDAVVGVRDAFEQMAKRSYHLSAAKTLNPPVGGPPTGPIYRLHLSVGTADNTLLGEERHEGLFGGVQILLKPMYPQVGLVALHDGQDLITGLTLTPSAKWPTLKGGTYGDHWWIGANYTWNLNLGR